MKVTKLAMAAAAVASIVLAACGSDSKGATATTTAPSAAETTVAQTTAATDAPTTSAAPAFDMDTNGDGKVVFGIAAAGPRDDGGYYQALVDKAQQISKENGYADPIVVDNIQTDNAATELDNLAQQGVDAIFVGASEIADPLKDLIAKYPKIFWYCNCGAGYPANPGLAQSQDDSSEISYTAGYATGLLMKAKNAGTKTAFIGCCDLNFEKEAYLAFEEGLKAVDPSYSMKYIPSGSFQFDFDNTAGATEALNGAITDGAVAVYPYLGGAHEPLVKLANQKGLIVMSAGSSKACARTDLKYDIQVRFDGGDYLDTILKEIIAGKMKEGDTRVFHVGVDKEPGAQICKPTPDQQTAMDDLYKKIANGDFKADFGAIKGKAYGG